MADDPKTGSQDGVIAISDTPHAPFVFYEAAPAYGLTNGVISITLAATRTWIGPDGIVNDHVVTAYLRGNVQAALNLRNAIDQALLLASPKPEGRSN